MKVFNDQHGLNISKLVFDGEELDVEDPSVTPESVELEDGDIVDAE